MNFKKVFNIEFVCAYLVARYKEYKLNCMEDSAYIKMQYRNILGKEIDLVNPKTYTEKLNWLKLHDHNPLYHTLVDKYEVKSYVSSVIGEKYVIPCLGVWDRFEDIDFSKLPNEFVLKCTHDSGSTKICRDKNSFDIEDARRFYRMHLKKKYFYQWREWPYKKVKPRIIAEMVLRENSLENIHDYKFFCFGGVPKIMYISQDAASSAKTDFFDMEFNHLPIRMKDPNSEKLLKKPKEFEQMIELAKKLSFGIPHVRIDFYVVDNQIYFGEFTFFHNAGYQKVKPEEWNEKLGDWINIKEISSYEN